MTDYVIPPPATASLPVSTGAQRFPIRRVFCVGRNYAAHAREMGKDPDREPPFFFMKPADAVIEATGVIPYPTLTSQLDHEIEMVVALKAGGTNVEPRGRARTRARPWCRRAQLPGLRGAVGEVRRLREPGRDPGAG